MIYLASLKYCRNAAEAEDNLQDTFITVFERIRSYNGTGSFEGWMKRIAINMAIDKFKYAVKFNSEVNDGPDEDLSIPADTSISLDEVLKLIRELPDQYRLVFNLYELDDYSHKEIAAMLDISESTSKSNLHRAKSILKQKIQATRTEAYKSNT
jgi:RNA polymerase sigma-70 factor (ECF subfamily)